MEILMTAAQDVTAVSPAVGIGNGTVAPEQTGEQSPFGKLLTGLAVSTGQNAQVATTGQTVDMQLLEKLSQSIESSLTIGQAASANQKGSASTNAIENGVNVVMPEVTDALPPEGSVLTQQLAANVGILLSQSPPASKTAATKPQEESPAAASEGSTDQVLGMVNADVSVMLQMLRQPVLPAPDRVLKQDSAPVAAATPLAASVSRDLLSAEMLTAVPIVLGEKSRAVALQPAAPLNVPVVTANNQLDTASMPVVPTVLGEKPQAVVPSLQPSAPLNVPAAPASNPAEVAMMPAVPNEQGRTLDSKHVERAAFRQKLAEQGVSVEAISADKPFDQPEKIDPGFMEVVIRESAEPTAAGKDSGAVTPAERDKMSQTNPLMVHAQETPDQTKQIQAGSSEPAKPVNHEQIVSQVREKLAAVDMGREGGQVVLRLHPEELGELKINVRMDNQRLRIDIVTESPTVKEALLNNMNSLREVLAKQNIVMERFDVSTGGNSHQAFRDGRSWEQQTGANQRPTNRWTTPGAVDESLVANAAQYGSNRDYSMVDVRF